MHETETREVQPEDTSHWTQNSAAVWMDVTLHEGKNRCARVLAVPHRVVWRLAVPIYTPNCHPAPHRREVRNIVKHLGMSVGSLERTSFGPYTLGWLGRGDALKVKLKPQLRELAGTEWNWS